MPIVMFEGRNEVGQQGQWVAAGNLKVGQKVLLANGKNGIITKVETEDLDNPITTYNFEVEDFHTYYVGEEGILVHNCCDESLLQQQAVAARDAKVVELRNTLSSKDLKQVATVVGGYNKVTGDVAVGVKIFGSGNFCAEALVVELYDHII